MFRAKNEVYEVCDGFERETIRQMVRHMRQQLLEIIQVQTFANTQFYHNFNTFACYDEYKVMKDITEKGGI